MNLRAKGFRERGRPAGAVPYETKELSQRTLKDFEKLAVQQGSCWCIYYQRARPATRGMTPDERRERNVRDKRKLVKEDRAHAAIVYDGSKPVGWCQYGVADELPRIDAMRNYKKLGPPQGPERLWRITCFFVDKDHRGMGVAKAGLRSALESIKKKGGGVVEAYPVVSKKMLAVPEWKWFGTTGMFEHEGFEEVSPLGTSLMLMRKKVKG